MARILFLVRTLGEECARWKAVPLIRLHFIVEGQTEETFVNQVLKPELAATNIMANVQTVTTKRKGDQIFRGGARNYERLAGDLTRWMRQDQGLDSWFTTMVDLYALPHNFPGHADHAHQTGGAAMARHLQSRFVEDIVGRLGGLPVGNRLIPYIQVHEFEALLFSDPEAFRTVFPDDPKVTAKIARIRKSFETPEDINCGQHTAPSKRIAAVCRDYKKVTAGVLIAQHIGLSAIRRECPHFNAWFESLLALNPTT